MCIPSKEAVKDRKPAEVSTITDLKSFITIRPSSNANLLAILTASSLLTCHWSVSLLVFHIRIWHWKCCYLFVSFDLFPVLQISSTYLQNLFHYIHVQYVWFESNPIASNVMRTYFNWQDARDSTSMIIPRNYKDQSHCVHHVKFLHTTSNGYSFSSEIWEPTLYFLSVNIVAFFFKKSLVLVFNTS